MYLTSKRVPYETLFSFTHFFYNLQKWFIIIIEERVQIRGRSLHTYNVNNQKCSHSIKTTLPIAHEHHPKTKPTLFVLTLLVYIWYPHPLSEPIYVVNCTVFQEFRLIHYAGAVTYNIKTFLEKNNDLLFRDLREAMTTSTNSIIKSVFLEAEQKSKKRPETAITQFKISVNNLMNILRDKEPSYIRCIKPNEFKKSSKWKYISWYWASLI